MKLTLLSRAFLELFVPIYLSLKQHSFLADGGGHMHFMKSCCSYPPLPTKSLRLCPVSKFLPLLCFLLFPPTPWMAHPPALLCPFRLDDQPEVFFSSLLSTPEPHSSLSHPLGFICLYTLTPPPQHQPCLPGRMEGRMQEWELDTSCYETCAPGSLQLEKYHAKDRLDKD